MRAADSVREKAIVALRYVSPLVFRQAPPSSVRIGYLRSIARPTLAVGDVISVCGIPRIMNGLR